MQRAVRASVYRYSVSVSGLTKEVEIAISFRSSPLLEGRRSCFAETAPRGGMMQLSGERLDSDLPRIIKSHIGAHRTRR